MSISYHFFSLLSSLVSILLSAVKCLGWPEPCQLVCFCIHMLIVHKSLLLLFLSQNSVPRQLFVIMYVKNDYRRKVIYSSIFSAPLAGAAAAAAAAFFLFFLARLVAMKKKKRWVKVLQTEKKHWPYSSSFLYEKLISYYNTYRVPTRLGVQGLPTSCQRPRMVMGEMSNAVYLYTQIKRKRKKKETINQEKKTTKRCNL